MKKIFSLLLVLGFIMYLGSCEKDDICVDGDTPLLVISFYDIDNPETAKAVTKLRVVGVGKDSTVNTISDRTDLDSIGLPLQSGANITRFIMIKNSAYDTDTTFVETGNIDTLSFNYVVKEQFVSRACGYIANYDNLETSLTTDTDNWIKDITVVDTLIKDQTAAHVKIFH